MVGSSLIGISIFALVFFQIIAADDSISVYDDGILKAVIIDQLHDEIPNENFQKQVTDYLVTAGYEVDIFTTKDITVDFYKNLPTLNYEFIVIRSHAIKGNDLSSPVLFTGEKYTEDKYVYEQLSGHVRKGAAFTTVAPGLEINYDDMTIDEETGDLYYRAPVEYNTIDSSDSYFVVGSELVGDLMIGNFPDTIIVIGGCSALSNDKLAQSLVNRGASLVVGWDDLVTSYDNDRALLEVLKNHLLDNLEIGDSVDAVMKDFIFDTRFPSKLKVFSHL